MIITKIEKQKNNAKRYSVFLDYEFAFGIDEIDLLYYKLKEDEDLSEEKYNFLLKNLLLTKAKNKALKYLGYKMRSKSQVIQKLKEDDFPESVVDKVIEFLEKYNYINDENFCKSYIKDKINLKGYGSFKISYELKQLGIEEQVFEKYLYDIDFVDEQKKAIELLNKKLRKFDIETLDYKDKQKIFAYLARRGFSYDCINKAFKQVLEDIDIYE